MAAQRPPRKPRRTRQGFERILVYAALVLVTALFLFPLLWVLSTSIKGQAEYFTYPPVWIPRHPTLEHYRYIISTTGLQLTRS